MNPFLSLPEYEQFVYTLQQQYSAVLRSTLTIARQGRGLARLTVELHLINVYRLMISEILIWYSGSLLIQTYDYEIWCACDKRKW